MPYKTRLIELQTRQAPQLPMDRLDRSIQTLKLLGGACAVLFGFAIIGLGVTLAQ